MRKDLVLFFGFLLTLLLFAILPANYQIFSTIIPLITLAICIVNSKDKFNFQLVLFLLLILIFIPSNWMLFDSSLDSFVLFKTNFESAFSTITAVVLLGAPAVLIGFGIYSLIATNAVSGVSALLKGLGILAFALAILGLLDTFSLLPDWLQSTWDILSKIFDFVVAFITGIYTIFVAIINAISEYITTAVNDANQVSAGNMTIVDWLWNRIVGIFEKIWELVKDDVLGVIDKAEQTTQAVANEDTRSYMWDQLWTNPDYRKAVIFELLQLDSTQYSAMLVVFGRGYPVILSFLCLVFSIAFRFNKHFQKDLDRFNKPQDDEFYYEFRSRFDFGILGQLLITLVVSFFLYLGMNEGGFSDPTFFGVYLAIIIVSTFVILLQLIPARNDSIKNFLIGSVLGAVGLFLFTNLSSSQQLDVLESNSITSQQSRLFAMLTTVFFTSPAETLLFQIVLPGFSLLLIYYIYKGRIEAVHKERIEKRIALLNKTLEKERTKYQHSISMNRKSSLDSIQTKIFNLENEIALLKLQSESKIRRVEIFTLMTANWGSLVLSILFVFIIPSFAFASLHVVKSSLSFIDFFNFGPGFLIMSCGAWITFISLRFGYNSAMGVHSINNLFTILLFGGMV